MAFGTPLSKLWGESEERKDFNIYELLSNLPAVFVTTNYDWHAEEALAESFGKRYAGRFKDRVFDLSLDGFDSNNWPPSVPCLYHLHGRWRSGDRGSLVLTSSDYNETYGKGSRVASFLGRLFSDCSVLFLGYGMKEFSVLGNMMGGSNHNVVEGFFSHELEYTSEKAYYDSLGLILVPYSKDDGGFDGLFKIVDDAMGLVKEVPKVVERVRNLLNAQTRDVDEILLQYKMSSLNDRDFILRLIGEAADATNLFGELQQMGCFNLNEIDAPPRPKRKGQKQQWRPLKRLLMLVKRKEQLGGLGRRDEQALMKFVEPILKKGVRDSWVRRNTLSIMFDCEDLDFLEEHFGVVVEWLALVSIVPT